jgi:hypothetical protein
MKKLTALALGCLLMTSPALAGQPSEADQKWAAAVEKMIEKGVTQISTPDAKRAELAVELAKKQNRAGRIEKKEHGFHVIIGAPGAGTVVASRNNE